MRSDDNLQKRFAKEDIDARVYGNMPGVLDTNTKVNGKKVLRSHSFSGSELNSVFHNRGGRSFSDISGVSGLDSIADSRAFVYFDYDRDGRTDIALTNTNEPQLQLFRNEIPAAGNTIHVRLIGGNQSSQPNTGWSVRDGYGAHVLVEAGELRLRRELRCGDGFASQNSLLLPIGIGSNETARKVTVEWPSGRRSMVETVAAGSVVTIRENSAQGKPSLSPLAPAPPLPGNVEREDSPHPALDLPLPAARPDFSMVICMATWCAVCQGEIPHLKRLKEATAGRIAFFGFPVDRDDDAGKLLAYADTHSPPYEILTRTNDPHRDVMAAYLNRTFGNTPLPSTLLLDREGRVMASYKGTPTLSDLRGIIR